MTTTCPKGHESDAADWCSVCGEKMDPSSSATPASSAEAAPTATAAGGLPCENCAVERHPDDAFCENCGYDFASGSLPDAPPDEPGDAVGQLLHARVNVDEAFFRATVGDVELDLPDPVPSESIVALQGVRILIGRRSDSRAIFPEIDARILTGDPAVSTRHAMLERDPQGSWTLTDLGSTNGTFLSPEADEAIEAGAAVTVTAGTSIFLGAWTRINLNSTGG